MAPAPTVRANDFAFAFHALILCCITYSQLFSRLWRFDEIPGKRASRVTQGIFCGSIVGLVLVGVLVAVLQQDPREAQSWAAIDVVSVMSCIRRCYG